MAHCRTCSCSIRFDAMRTGSSMPVDPVPDDLGNVAATRDQHGGLVDGNIVSPGQPVPAGYIRFMPHYGPCARPPSRAKPRAPRQQPAHTLF